VPASWPTSIFIATTKVDVTDVNYAAHINALQDEVIAIETSLGLGVKGAYASVDARLDDIEADKFNTADIGTISHNSLADLTTGNPHTQYILKSLGTAKGQLIGFTGSGAPGVLAVSTDGRVLEADAASTLGWRWGTAPIKASVGTTKGDLLAFDGTNWVRLAVGATNGHALVVDSAETTGLKWAATTPEQMHGFQFPGALVVATGRGRLRWPWDVTILGVATAINTPPTGATVIVDVNKLAAGTGAATTIYSTQANRPTIAIGDYSSTETAPNTTTFSAGDHMTVDVDQIGSSTPGSDLTVWVRFKRT